MNLFIPCFVLQEQVYQDRAVHAQTPHYFLQIYISVIGMVFNRRKLKNMKAGEEYIFCALAVLTEM